MGWNVTYRHINRPPTFAAISGVGVPVGTSAGTVVLDLNNYIADADSPNLTVTIQGTLASWLAFNAATKQITTTKTVANTDPNTTVQFVVSDGYNE